VAASLSLSHESKSQRQSLSLYRGTISVEKRATYAPAVLDAVAVDMLPNIALERQRGPQQCTPKYPSASAPPEIMN
jgi:hypothetical protein